MLWHSMLKVYKMKILKTKEKSGNLFHKTPASGSKRKIIYPDSDGKPMADNTKQYRWIVTIKENLEDMFGDNPDVFVAGDLFWYPVENNNKIRTAPDVMVVLGSPKGDRGSYMMWEEGNIAPQVVFEILSPGNRRKEMDNKFDFYEKYGVQEYYIYDPDRIRLNGWIRKGGVLSPVENMQGWISPLLNIRFELQEDDLHIFTPDGEKFLTPLESKRMLQAEILAAEQRAEKERRKANDALKREKAERQRTEKERREKERLAEKLRQLGIDPDE